MALWGAQLLAPKGTADQETALCARFASESEEQEAPDLCVTMFCWRHAPATCGQCSPKHDPAPVRSCGQTQRQGDRTLELVLVSSVLGPSIDRFVLGHYHKGAMQDA